jgi:hypothetical protein
MIDLGRDESAAGLRRATIPRQFPLCRRSFAIGRPVLLMLGTKIFYARKNLLPAALHAARLFRNAQTRQRGYHPGISRGQRLLLRRRDSDLLCNDWRLLPLRAPPVRFRGKAMINFTPISAAIGGALIGLAAVLLMRLNGRIAGITGIFAGLIDPGGNDRVWRATFIIGLIAAPLCAALLGWSLPSPRMPMSLTLVAGAGLLVGFGTRLSNGCTSGHGVCGIARLSPRSIAATAIFMAAAVAVVALTRHLIGA